MNENNELDKGEENRFLFPVLIGKFMMGMKYFQSRIVNFTIKDNERTIQKIEKHFVSENYFVQ